MKNDCPRNGIATAGKKALGTVLGFRYRESVLDFFCWSKKKTLFSKDISFNKRDGPIKEPGGGGPRNVSSYVSTE